VILEALEKADRTLASDPWAPYVCARHREQAGDAMLAGFFLCDDCRSEYSTKALGSAPPEWVSDEAVDGYCGHCNSQRTDIRYSQWHLCGVCERVLRSIGRGIASAKYVFEVWEHQIFTPAMGLRLVESDPPQLRPPGKRSDVTREVKPDFELVLLESGATVAGFETKTGKNPAARGGGIGSPMGRFQLDTTDCDDILAVVNQKLVPIYLVHVQVLGRAVPPTERYHGVGLWWTDLWSMEANFNNVAVRARETRNAAYYNPKMFLAPIDLRNHLLSGGIRNDQAKLKLGMPRLYRAS
jgi:hypothetical protein